jgi:hypothetical protein
MVADASSHWDEMDQPEPPVIGEYVSVYFPHRNWEALAKFYCVDARPESKNGEIWELEIKTNIRDKITLSFSGLASVPEEFEVWLIDEAVPLAQNLREIDDYSIAGLGPGHPKRLKLVAGKNNFIALNLAGLPLMPKSYELSQNFPNPFNPATTIRFGLPKTERVTLKVYTLLGEELVTLVDEQKAAGYHVAIWDGRNQAGNVVVSGVYIYRLRAGNVVVTKKMALVR